MHCPARAPPFSPLPLQVGDGSPAPCSPPPPPVSLTLATPLGTPACWGHRTGGGSWVLDPPVAPEPNNSPLAAGFCQATTAPALVACEGGSCLSGGLSFLSLVASGLGTGPSQVSEGL